MADSTPQQQDLLEENRKLRQALDEISAVIQPYLGPKQAASRPPERQAVHDVRNLVNELGLLRALVPGDDEK